ncbi:MAG: LysR family transcriptional regulator [Erysipelotrichaceae bacterium]|uniref:LysR family transcriptional regulator n=1 Tax=Floccifex sp. TaxID=2815810 RepID=UPI002A764700|nr:LysR family transcriptional regulator [Floccifex sp.]MDD7282108.1 LysR family transcriptional regulator [Erysipelotrichaceae bacterium]MDY2957436.1 LysR family transcriptional regulator [Floccifex sp.]
MNNVSYDYYRIFYYVAKYKSISQAAKILHSNQPNITKFMNKLEQQLGCKLMNRSNKGISLTPEGEQLFEHVTIAYNQLQEAEQQLSSARQLQTGTIRISTTEIGMHGVLLSCLLNFRKKYPNIHFMISNESCTQAIESLKKGMADFALVTTPLSAPFNFKTRTLKSFEEILVASCDFDCHQNMEMKDILSYPIISLGRHAKTYELYEQIFSSDGLEWKPDIEVATADQILPMIKMNLGIGFVPDFIVQEDLEKGLVKQVSNLKFKRDIVLLEDTTIQLNIASKTFKEHMIKKTG